MFVFLLNFIQGFCSKQGQLCLTMSSVDCEQALLIARAVIRYKRQYEGEICSLLIGRRSARVYAFVSRNRFAYSLSENFSYSYKQNPASLSEIYRCRGHRVLQSRTGNQLLPSYWASDECFAVCVSRERFAFTSTYSFSEYRYAPGG